MSAGEFRAKAVDRTIEYLELDPAGATTFTRTVEDALKDIQEARSRMAWAQTQVPFNPDDPGSVVKHKSSWDRFAHDQEAAIARVIALVGDAPRHRLFRDQTAKWILYVDYHTKER